MTTDFTHGGALDYMRSTFPKVDEPWIDLSTGINPWPWPVGTLSDDSIKHLPSVAAFELCRAAMAAAFGAPSSSVLPAPGSEMLIRLLPKLISPDSVAILTPSYGDHANVWNNHCQNILPMTNPLEVASKVDCVVVCHPNNPDGRTFQPEQLEVARQALAARGGWLIIDEAYCELSPSHSLASTGGMPGLIILRSMGKFFGLAGLRLGALIAPPKLLQAMHELLGMWCISGLTLDIGIRAYTDSEWQDATRTKLTAARRRLDEILVSAQTNVTGGTDLYRFIEHHDAHDLWTQLAQAGIYTRRFDWSHHHLRIGLPPNSKAEQRLASAL